MEKVGKVYDIPGACSNFLDELNKFIINKLKLKIKLISKLFIQAISPINLETNQIYIKQILLNSTPFPFLYIKLSKFHKCLICMYM